LRRQERTLPGVPGVARSGEAASSHDVFIPIARARLRERGVAQDVRDDVALVVSELFTDTLRYPDSEKIACAVQVEGGVVRVETAEQGARPIAPPARAAEPREECGRGVLLVGALCRAGAPIRSEDGNGMLARAELGAAADTP
jgi:serine/threonine-protein kinase RsbW